MFFQFLLCVDSDAEVMGGYSDPEERQDKLLQRSTDHGLEGESIVLSPRQKEEARGKGVLYDVA